MIGDLIILILALLLMACFSAAETSFVSADKVALAVDSERAQGLRSLMYFLNNNDLFFATVVMATNMFITAFSSISELVFHETLGLRLWIVLPLTTVVGFVIGEFVPKSFALKNPEKTAKLLLPFVDMFHKISSPIIGITARVSSYLARRVFHSTGTSLIFQRRDIYRFLGDTVGSGYLDKIESDIIRSLLSGAAVPVKNIAVPRTAIVSASVMSSLDELRAIFEKSAKTKIIIYDSSIDNVIGVVHTKDIFKEANTAHDIMSDVLFVPEGISVIDLLEKFRSEQVYVAILIDEFGGTSGLVTASDVLELFLGEVAVRYPEEKIVLVKPKQYVLKGDTEIAEIEKNLKVRLPSRSEYTTIAGLVIYQLGRIPLVGERIDIGRTELRILKSDGKRLDTLQMILK